MNWPNLQIRATQAMAHMPGAVPALGGDIPRPTQERVFQLMDLGPTLAGGSSEPLQRQAAALLDQQIWCWGQDVNHPDGNHLACIGFQRIPPPRKRKGCSSVYHLPLDGGGTGARQSVILRGFGVFYSDETLGTVFLPRYSFQPLYSPRGSLKKSCWSMEDLPKMRLPTPDDREQGLILLFKMLHWILSYETDIVKRYGLHYRREIVGRWDNGERLIFPAERMAAAWRKCLHFIPYQLDPWAEGSELESCLEHEGSSS